MSDDIRTCEHCGKEVKRSDMMLTKDRYGIPYKFVCENCYDEVQEEIEQWEFNEADAGESLEPDW